MARGRRPATVARTKNAGLVRHVRVTCIAEEPRTVTSATEGVAPGPGVPLAAASASGLGPAPGGTAGTAGPKRRRQADTTDAVATFLTRRFGLAGGLTWLSILAAGTLGEQVKTRMEVAAEERGARDVLAQREVELPDGVKYTDLRIGGGQQPRKGYLVVLDYVGKADGVVFEDTKARGKPIVYLFGSRPFTGGLCVGAEEALAGMQAGGRRIAVIPPALGFGDRGAVLAPTGHVPDKQGIIPPGATLEYELELVRVSIPPS